MKYLSICLCVVCVWLEGVAQPTWKWASRFDTQYLWTTTTKTRSRRRPVGFRLFSGQRPGLAITIPFPAAISGFEESFNAFWVQMGPDGMVTHSNLIYGKEPVICWDIAHTSTGDTWALVEAFSDTLHFVHPGGTHVHNSPLGFTQNLAKYDPAGHLEFVFPVNYHDIGLDPRLIADAGEGNLFVTGICKGMVILGRDTLDTGASNRTEAFMAKLDANGEFIWESRPGNFPPSQI